MLEAGKTYFNQHGIAVQIEGIENYEGYAKHYAAGSSGFARSAAGACFWADGPYAGKYWSANRVDKATGQFHKDCLKDMRDLILPVPQPDQLPLFDFQ